MNQRMHIPQKKRILLLLAACALLIISAGAAYAQGTLELPWWTADGGGGLSQGGDFTLHGTAGQPDAGSMQGGDYALSGGFWAGGGGKALLKVYLPLTQK
jgi:hypothetical protein